MVTTFPEWKHRFEALKVKHAEERRHCSTSSRNKPGAGALFPAFCLISLPGLSLNRYLEMARCGWEVSHDHED